MSFILNFFIITEALNVLIFQVFVKVYDKSEFVKESGLDIVFKNSIFKMI